MPEPVRHDEVEGRLPKQAECRSGLVFGLPLPGLIGGGAIADLTGKRLASLVGALAITGIGIWQLFRLIRRSGVGEAAGN